MRGHCDRSALISSTHLAGNVFLDLADYGGDTEKLQAAITEKMDGMHLKYSDREVPLCQPSSVSRLGK